MPFGRFKCAVPCALLFVVAVTPSASSAIIGNVTSFSADGPDVTFNISDGSRVMISVFAPDMARVRIVPDGVFRVNVSQAVVKDQWAAVSFTTNDSGSQVTISTPGMRLIVNKSPFTLECQDVSGNLVLRDDPSRRVQWDSGRTEVYKQTQSGEKYLGLGWRTHGLVRNGTLFSMRNRPTYNDATVFYSGVPFWYGYRNGSFYGMFFDDASWGQIDVGQSSSSYMSFENLGGQVDYYYFAGQTMAGILDRFTELTGRPFMPPRWSLGYQQCRWSYTPRSQVLAVADTLRARQIPCDVIYLDIDYMPGGHQLMFDGATFPDPESMLATLHAQGFKVVANISPFLFLDDPKYGSALGNNYLLKKADGSVHVGWHDYWYFLGGAGTGSMAWLDFTKTSARNWWANQHVPFVAKGIDGIWNDLNEPDELGGSWPTNLKYDYDGQPVDHNKASTQYATFQTELSYDILQNYCPDKRPFVLSRGGFAGIQRSSALWSGDNTGDWVDHLKKNIPMGLSLSISGSPFNGHDIGGFFSKPERWSTTNRELYVRWMQCGVFSPFCRQHHDGNGNKLNGGHAHAFVEPYRYDAEAEGICRDWIELRYRLMPYLYTLFHRAHVSGAPIQRPTLYDFPSDANTLNQSHDFMFGPSMLVSPVTAPYVSVWWTYLPAGADWVDYWDDSLHTGGQNLSSGVTLDQIPIYIRSGSIVPMAPVAQYDGEQPWDELTLESYPHTGGAPASFTLYEDDGISWAYQSGDYAETTFTMSGNGDGFEFSIGARQGTYQPTSRSHVIKVHRWAGHTTGALLNGESLLEYVNAAAFAAADSGVWLDQVHDVLYVRIADGVTQSPAESNGDAYVLTFGGPRVFDVPGDMDSDGDVDQEDFGLFQACLSGSGIVQDEPACSRGRLDTDADVDQDDAALFAGCMTGANIPGDPYCMEP